MGQYREKECPQCGVKHRQRGPYCSKSCSNLARSPKVYEKVSKWMKESDKGQEITYQLHNDPEQEPPVAGGYSNPNVPRNGFVEGGDLWITDNGDW